MYLPICGRARGIAGVYGVRESHAIAPSSPLAVSCPRGELDCNVRWEICFKREWELEGWRTGPKDSSQGVFEHAIQLQERAVAS